jgi:hypothetical protein
MLRSDGASLEPSSARKLAGQGPGASGGNARVTSIGTLRPKGPASASVVAQPCRRAVSSSTSFCASDQASSCHRSTSLLLARQPIARGSRIAFVMNGFQRSNSFGSLRRKLPACSAANQATSGAL